MSRTRLTKRDWAIINTALAILEATPPGGDVTFDSEEEEERFAVDLERVRQKVWDRI